MVGLLDEEEDEAAEVTAGEGVVVPFGVMAGEMVSAKAEWVGEVIMAPGDVDGDLFGRRKENRITRVLREIKDRRVALTMHRIGSEV